MSVRIVLAPESASVPQARRFVAEQLSDLSSETVDLARLLVSEVVTNAVLHAGTEATLTLERSGSKVKVEVEDSNPLLPVMRSHGAEAGTGRGLHVLDRLASNWGTSTLETGKVVWFEIPTAVQEAQKPEDRAAGESGQSDEGTASVLDETGADRGVLRDPRSPRHKVEPGEHLVKFGWTRLPLGELDRTAEHYDAVLREFHLVLEREPNARAAVPGRLIAIMDELTKFTPLISSVEQDLERARRAGMAFIDVAFDLPSEIGPLALRLDNLLDETDAYCAAGVELLSLEPPNNVVALRKWLIGELVRQAEGHPPVAWPDSPWGRSPVGGHRRRQSDV